MSIIDNPADATVVGHSFSYDIELPYNFLNFYVFAVVTPLLISSQRGLVIFGLVLTASLAITMYMATSETFPSAWCFFAALLSLGLYLHFKHSAREIFEEDDDRQLRRHGEN